MSSRFATRPVRRSVSSSIVPRNNAVSSGDHVDFVVAEARHGGLDRRERRPQVVRHGGEDGGPERVRLRACRRDRRLLCERPAADGERRAARRTPTGVAIVGGEPAPAEREDRVAAERRPPARPRRGVGGAVPAAASATVSGRPSTTVLPAKHRDRIDAEGRSRVLDELRERIALGGDARGQRARAPRPRRRARCASARSRASRSTSDAHADRDDHEHDQRNHVLGVRRPSRCGPAA